MSLPKVSVVMSVYNGAEYVGQAIESILAQTLDDFEFLIVDDASTDNTSKILASFNDPRITILKNEKNVGLAESLNRGVASARGTYIARQDADDVSQPERLLRQVRYLDLHATIGVVGVATQWIDNEDKPFNIWPSGKGNSELQQLLMHTCPLIHGSTMYRRQCFDEIGGYEATMRTGQDYDFWLRISETWDLVCLPDILYQYRWHQDMVSVSREEEQVHHAAIGLADALQRRRSYIRLVLGLGRHRIPPRLRTMTRRQLSERYVWWSAGARQSNRHAALVFLIAAFLFDPGNRPMWAYLKGIVGRKVKKVAGLDAPKSATIHPSDV